MAFNNISAEADSDTSVFLNAGLVAVMLGSLFILLFLYRSIMFSSKDQFILLAVSSQVIYVVKELISVPLLHVKNSALLLMIYAATLKAKPFQTKC